MPDLNLIDEGGFDEAPVPVAPPAKKKISKGGSGGGGGGTKFLIIFFVLILVGGAVYVLNQRGIIKLWGQKKAQVAQMQEEPFQQEPIDQPAQEPTQAPQQQTDTSHVALVETAPVEEKAEPPKETVEKEEVAETESVSKLSEMSGEFTVQVIAYHEKSKAVETSKNLEYAGYPSFVEKVPMKGGDWYTVRIGKYPSRKDAQKAVKNFAAQLQAHYVIDKIRKK
jgi:cell division septation protein DedD